MDIQILQRQVCDNSIAEIVKIVDHMFKNIVTFGDCLSFGEGYQAQADQIFLKATKQERYSERQYLANMENFDNTRQQFVAERRLFDQNLQFFKNLIVVVEENIRSMDLLQKRIMGVNDRQNIEDLMGQLFLADGNADAEDNGDDAIGRLMGEMGQMFLGERMQ